MKNTEEKTPNVAPHKSKKYILWLPLFFRKYAIIMLPKTKGDMRAGERKRFMGKYTKLINESTIESINRIFRVATESSGRSL